MGRRKKEEVTVQRHLRVPEKTDEGVQAEGERLGLPYNDVAVKFMQKGLRERIRKYKGFKEELMSEDWTCFECGREFKRGRLAMYDRNTGATMCPECAVENELTTKAAVKLYIKRLRLIRDNKALKIENEREAEKYIENMLIRTNKLVTLGILEKIPGLFEKAHERQKEWMRFREEQYEIEGKSEKETFEDFMRHDEEMITLLRSLKTEYERVMEERQRLLAEKAKKVKKKKKTVTAS